MNHVQRLQRYAEQTEQMQELYSSVEAAKHNKAMSLRYRFTETQFSAYLDVTGDTILGFYRTKDLLSLLEREVGVTADIAKKIVVDLAELFAPVLAREAAEINPKQAAMKDLHQQFSTSTTTAKSPAAPAPFVQPLTPTRQPISIPQTITKEESADPTSLHNVTPMRTMATDMTRIHGYGAYRQTASSEEQLIKAAPQEELLKNKPRLAGTPKVGE